MNRLITIRHRDKSYFVDVRLQELRNIDCPADRVDFDDIFDPVLSERVAEIYFSSLQGN